MIIYKIKIDMNTFNTIKMSYFQDEPNVRDFYSKFCEYLETDTEQEDFNRYMTHRYIPYSHTSYLIYVYIRFTQFDNFTKFKTLYLTMNPHLIIYEEEFKKHKFNYDIFRKEIEEFNTISYLK